MGNELSRRGVLAGAAAVGATIGLAGAADAAESGPLTIRRGDPRYDGLVRANNFRFVGDPDEVRLAGTTGQVVRAVSDAVRAGRRVAVRSGGHCFENFTADPAARTLIDLSQLDAVGFDPVRRAFFVEPGATLGQVYKTLGRGWGVTIPAGGCPEVGAGGHIAGGGYGPLSRRYGAVVDHLEAVEVVVADRAGVRAVVASRDRNQDLWWAHTGGGGGNFGVVTRYWLRSPGATGTDPARLLPPQPREMLTCLAVWSWDEQALARVLRNFGTWMERNSAPGSPNAGLYPILDLKHRDNGGFELTVQADADLPGVDRLVTDLVTGLGVEPAYTYRHKSPWSHMTTWPGLGQPGDVATRRYKIKAAYLNRSFTDAQIAAIRRHLSGETTVQGGMQLIGYGGQVGAVAPEATAIAQRGAIMKAVYSSLWLEQSDDAANLAWVREFYRDVYSSTGGVPVDDGSYINYPDVDLADPAWNTSGVPWQTLYYQGNYPRLRQVKARWDPRNVFTHALGI
ncbi:FAD-binding oxidoreductase [Amycolatopsis sp. BJA-103]|uniref:FAD-binding oxidoreductase n=1 Tax=Amycolatopsis sp. BJA-103 TaxID=1911175 RepID=UPI000C7758B0|nr:FAD-binding protein [Amycolatopsis sp. BJA-103]AUI61591.1 FAD-linked oxidase [Amycolatopsis sp. BJA-103]PNE21116.1 FAD-linked oxidase [Amycolatopsis sp. BJA-103]